MMSEIDEKIKEGLDMAFGKGLKAGGLMLAGAIKHMIKTGVTFEELNEFLDGFIERNEYEENV